MKKIIAISALIGGLFILNACSNDDDDATNGSNINDNTEQVSQFVVGELVTKEFLVDDEVVVSIDDEVVNFGTDEVPALFLIHKNTRQIKEGYEDVFFPLYREKLEAFILKWKEVFASVIGEDTGVNRGRPFIHFLNFMLANKLDPGLLIRVAEEQQKIDDVLRLVGTASKIVTKSDRPSGSANDILLWLYESKVSASELIEGVEKTGMDVEAFLSEMYMHNGNFSQLNMIQTKGTVGNVISIFKSVVNIVEIWVKFADNNGPVVNMESNYISFLNADDTNPAHYTGGQSYKSKTYSLKYKVSGIWFAKAKYHIETVYNAKHKTIPGLYIPSCNVICEEADAGGPKFSVNGSVSYSPPVNKGTFDTPIAQMNGKVSIDYGDCCCCHYFSYLNFSISAKEGYKEKGFSTGRN